MLDTSGPEGGRGIGLRSGTELLSPLEQEEDVGVAETETWLVGAFSVSVLCLALTMPTGMVEVWPAVVVILSAGPGPLTDLSKQEVGILLF